MTRPGSEQVEAGLSKWERGFNLVIDWLPYVTLAVSLLFALVSPGDWASRLPILGLAIAAAAWTLFMFTLPGGSRSDKRSKRLYYLGFILLAAALMFQSPTFFVYLITGFVHAYTLTPAPLAFVGVGVTSLLINRGIVIGEPSASDWWTYGLVVAFQTAVVGTGLLGGEKIAELSEMRGRWLRELEAAQVENAGLHAQLVAQAREAGVMDERQRLASEIHDTIAQGLTGVITQLEAAALVKHEPAEVQRRLDTASRLARESLAEARRSVHALMPVSLEARSLPDAIENEARTWSALHQLPVQVTTTGKPVALPPEVEVSILRVAQEALANIGKHAAATRIGVTLSYMGDVITIDVRDNGRGFETKVAAGAVNVRSSLNGGFGLASMRQRVEALAGHIHIESTPGEGTAVSASLPIVQASDITCAGTSDG